MWAPRRSFRPPWGDVSENKRFTYQPALDGLRAFAVLSVFAYHLDAGWMRGGFLGVDTFFVLSGFLITSLLIGEWARRGGISFAGFWARRARRLLPALLLVLLAVAAFAVLEVPADQLDRLRGDGLATLFYGANWRFIESGQSYFDLFSEASPLRHMWSLAIEEQFYLVWPLITFACLRLARGRHWLLGLVCGAGAGASIATMAVLYDPATPPAPTTAPTPTRSCCSSARSSRSCWRDGVPARGRGASVNAAGLAGAVTCLASCSSTTPPHSCTAAATSCSGCALPSSSRRRCSRSVRVAVVPLARASRVDRAHLLRVVPVALAGHVVASPSRTGLDGASLTACASH